MTFRDWIIVGGVVAALPVWLIAVRHQWSNEQGATGRMLKWCAIFAAILIVAGGAAYLMTN